jgi:hypothetical protein
MSAQLVQMQVSQKRLVSHLKFSFSNQTTFLGELLQNGRRAKATRIVITQDPREGVEDITIEDDGIGIDDFQKLIFVAESGWDQETIERESAYGLGFLSSLFAADHITVESRGLRLSAKTESILDFQPVALEPVEERPGTRITLRGLRTENIDGDLRRLVKGFPVEVLWNGEVLKRPHAINSGLLFQNTDVGDMYVYGLERGCDTPDRYSARAYSAGNTSVTLYLQGLPVYSSYGNGDSIVHLDPRQYFGRLPDRDKLIDQDQALNQVQETLHDVWRQYLTAERDQHDRAEYVEAYYQTIRYWKCLDLLNDLDILPRQALEIVDTYPRQTVGEESPLLVMGKQHIARWEVEAKGVHLFTLPSLEEGGAQAQMYAWLTGMLLLDGNALDPGHWAHAHVVDLQANDLTVVIPKPLAEGIYNGNWLCNVDVVLCAGYEIDGPLGTVRNTDSAFMLDGLLSVGNRHAALGVRSVIVPAGDNGGHVVTQLVGFYDENDQWDEKAEDEEISRFARFVRALKPGAAADVVRDLLISADLREYPGMAGKQFTVKLTRGGKITVKEIVKKK